MTIHALVTGALFKPPEPRLSKAGKPFVAGTLRTKDGDSFQFVRFVAFLESVQAELLCLTDGDAISAQGSLKAESYEKDGEHRVSLSMVADHVLTLRQPPKTRKDAAPPTDRRARQGRSAPGYFDDSIPFGEAR